MARQREYWVYIMSSKSRTLYVGITGNLAARVVQHKSGRGSVFTSRYHVTRLVYCVSMTDVREAINVEKQIKGWLREKKIALIESANPEWRNLSEDW